MAYYPALGITVHGTIVVGKAPFIGGFAAESADQNAQERSINWMPEKIDGKTQWRMRPTPGLRLFMTLPEYPVRGVFEASNNRTFIVAANTLYEIFADASYKVRGILIGGTGPVSMDDNGFQLVIVDGSAGWAFTFDSNELTNIYSEGFFPSPAVVVFDGYALMFRADSGVYFYSDIYDALSYDPTDEGTTETNPDPIQMIVWDGSGPVMLGTKSLEFYYTSDDPNLVFKRRQGAQLRYGCVAPYTALNLSDSVIWVGRDTNGQGSVYRVNGAQPVKLSSTITEKAIENVASVVRSTAMAYEQSGGAFYCLNIPGVDTTYVCDLSTSYWHERRSFAANGLWGRWRVEKHVLAFGYNIGADFENGNLYIIDQNEMTENGTIIARERTMTPLFDDNNLNNAFYDSFSLDVNVGDTSQNAPGDDPIITLFISDDGGKTFLPSRDKPLGKTGAYETRVKWRRCGRSRNRVFKVCTAASTNVTVYGAYVEVSR